MESNTSSPAKPIGFDGHLSHVGGDQVPERSLIELCLDAFYHHFHQAHPFVLPKRHFALVSEGNREPLLAAMRWIGSFYLNVGIFRDVLFHEAYRLSYRSGHSEDGFLIQALILLVIGLDGSGELERARAVLADAARLAVQMSLNTNDYAASNGRGMPILEESWRRTWWDLFVVDSMVAGIHRDTNFLLFEVPTDVALPCEEHDYFEGQDEDEIRQQIRLSMGALREMAEVWKAAEKSADQVNRVAQRLYRAKKEQQIPSQSSLGGFLNDVLGSSAVVDDTILGEAEAMNGGGAGQALYARSLEDSQVPISWQPTLHDI
ncbi:C6 zinc finger domain-containing protein [Fusarium proliferatum]|nr:C6 zinc finger domain-containing protein [Fusarium proliferatum]